MKNILIVALVTGIVVAITEVLKDKDFKQTVKTTFDDLKKRIYKTKEVTL